MGAPHEEFFRLLYEYAIQARRYHMACHGWDYYSFYTCQHGNCIEARTVIRRYLPLVIDPDVTIHDMERILKNGEVGPRLGIRVVK